MSLNKLKCKNPSTPRVTIKKKKEGGLVSINFAIILRYLKTSPYIPLPINRKKVAVRSRPPQACPLYIHFHLFLKKGRESSSSRFLDKTKKSKKARKEEKDRDRPDSESESEQDPG